MNDAQVAKAIIEHNTYMTIATADKAGKPWISPVFFSYDSGFNLYWVSYKETLHSKNIANRPEVAISIIGPAYPGGETDGVYFDATARELTDSEDIFKAIIFRNKRKQTEKFKIKSITDVTGDAAWRIYKATPISISKRGDGEASGQAITIRTEVNLLK